MAGKSELVYDFTNDDLDLTLTITGEGGLSGAAYGGNRTITWSNVKQNGDGSFFISGNHQEDTEPDPVLGVLDGDFYGPNAEEVAGYFERVSQDHYLEGVFGGKRQRE